MIDFHFVLDDLARTPTLSLAARPVSPVVIATLFLLKRARYALELLEELAQIAHVLGELETSPVPDEQRSALFTYTWVVGRVEVFQMVDFVRKHPWPNLEKAAMTTAERLIAQGIAEGRAEGLSQALLKQLRFKFKTVPPHVEQKVATASLAQLDQWLERVFTAESAEDVVRDE